MGRLRLEASSTFSFSSCSITLGAGLTLTAIRDILVFSLCSEFTDETLRWGILGVVTPSLADVDRDRPFAEGVGLLGVPTIEGRGFKEGGPIIEPSISARTIVLCAEDVIDEVPLPLTRVLFPRARTLADDADISGETFLFGICIVSVPESEITDGGRGCIGVAVKIEDSRRWDTLDGWAGVLPAVPLTPYFLFSYMEVIWIRYDK